MTQPQKPSISADQPITPTEPGPDTQYTSQTDRPQGTQQPPGTEHVQQTPPDFNTWTRDLPFDSAEFLGKPVVPVIDENDKAKMDAVRKYEQSLAGQGVKLLTPQFPELFPDAPKPDEAVKPAQDSLTQPDESEMTDTAVSPDQAASGDATTPPKKGR